MHRTLQKRRYELVPTLCWTILPCCVIFVALHGELQISTGLEEQTSAPPLRVYREADGETKLCVIPNVFECGNPSWCSNQPLFVPNAYAKFAKEVRDCLPERDIQFYSGRAPKVAMYAKRHDADVLGQSFTAYYYHHFPHFTVKFAPKVLVPASFLLPVPDAQLPTPICLYPGRLKNRSCEDRRYSLQPRILISKDVLGKPGDWVHEMVKLVTLGAITSVFPPKFLHVSPASWKWESFRTLITSPQSYQVDRNDQLLGIAGISRESKCTHRIVIITRDPRKQLDRTTPDATVRELVRELRRNSNSTVETVVGLGQLSFQQQVKLMQSADVVLVVHGAEVANTLFLRPGASVIEIHPFGYWMPDYFRSIRESVHLNYTALSSPPDATRFLACMKTRRIFSPSVSRAIRTFESHAKMYRAATDDRGRRKAGSFLMSTFDARRCCRAQVIDFEAVKTAQLVMRHARNRCNTT